MGKRQEPPQPCTVEELLRRIGDVSPSNERFELWVPEYLTLAGQPIDHRAAIALVMGRAREVSEDFVPVGFTRLPGGRLYSFER
jgi:hypothetical protein